SAGAVTCSLTTAWETFSPPTKNAEGQTESREQKSHAHAAQQRHRSAPGAGVTLFAAPASATGKALISLGQSFSRNPVLNLVRELAVGSESKSCGNRFSRFVSAAFCEVKLRQRDIGRRRHVRERRHGDRFVEELLRFRLAASKNRRSEVVGVRATDVCVGVLRIELDGAVKLAG